MHHAGHADENVPHEPIPSSPDHPSAGPHQQHDRMHHAAHQATVDPHSQEQHLSEHGTATHEPSPILINRNFALLWFGQLISNVGDYVFSTTIVLWIATVLARGQSWAPLSVSGVIVSVAVPTLLIGSIAGVFVDRWDKRRTMLLMDVLRAALIASLLLITDSVVLPFIPGGQAPRLWQLGIIYSIVFLTSSCSQFFNPSRFALISDIVPKSQRTKAIGLMQAITNLAIVVGPALAAPLFINLGVQWALIFNALSFIVSFICLVLMRTPPQQPVAAQDEHASFRRELADGLRFFGSNRILRTILISQVLVVLGVGCLHALDIFFLTENLRAPESLFGFLASALGLGSIVGATLAGLYGQRIGVIRAMWAGLFTMGLLTICYARLTNFTAAVVMLALLGLMHSAVAVVVGPIIMHVTPRHMLGRVMAVISPSVSLATIVSASATGVLASTVLRDFNAVVFGLHIGRIDTIFTVTGVLALLGGLYARRVFSGVRTIDIDPRVARLHH